MESGIFIRGILAGIKDDKDVNRKSGEEYPYKALGVNVPFVNSFGVKSFLTKEIRISQAKTNDSAFMKSLEANHGKFVEIEISLGDYGKIFVVKDCVLTPLETHMQKVS